MSSKRGRKRNDNLPPNRARDVQRAFRARRAAHLEVRDLQISPRPLPPPPSVLIDFFFYTLQALEQRVSELEDENNTLRAALNLPPANRPVLGKGPTGKDKPKPYSTSGSRNASGTSVPPAPTSRGGSSAESPSPTRTDSISPSTITANMRPSPHSGHNVDAGSWDQHMLLGDDQTESHTSPPSAGYSLSSINAHKPPQSQYSFPSPSSSRNPLSNSMYIPPVQQSTQNFAHTADRPMGDAYGNPGYPLRDIREEPQHFPYTQSPFSPTDGGQRHHHPPATPAIHAVHPPPRDHSGTLPYGHGNRRSGNEPQSYQNIVNHHYPHLPPPQSSTGALRRLSPPRISDLSHPTLRPPFSNGGD